MKRIAALAVVGLAALAFGVGFFVAGETAPAAAVPPGKEGKTVFVDISAFGRRDHAAKKMTELHGKMAQQGLTVRSVDVYIENGDLEGFFVTYVKE